MTARSDDRSPSLLRLLGLGLRRGAIVAVALGLAAETLAVLVWAFGGTGISLADALALGVLELGAIHRVGIRLEIRDLVTSAASRIDLTVGVALLSLTAVAAWALARSARRIVALAGTPGRRLALAGGVAAGYAAPIAVLLPLVGVETGRPGAEALRGVFGLSLVTWQALAFPWVLALVAAGAGALRAALEGRSADRGDRVDPGPRTPSAHTLEAGLAGAGRMLVVGFAAAFAGLFVGGVLAPDAAVALATPTTARYVRAVADRPVAGPVLALHHLAVAPAEAAWVLVPAMGGCVRVTGSFEGDLLCYGRYPVAMVPEGDVDAGLATPVGTIVFDRAPPAYLAFLLVPAIATVAGGIRAGRDVGAMREALEGGAFAGVVFAAAVTLLALVSTIGVRYVSDVAGRTTGGSFAVGPDPVAALGLGAAWGVLGGVLGAALSRWAR